VSGATSAEQFVIDKLMGKQMLPLAVARNGLLVPFDTVDDLDPGDEVLTITHH
jgi:hypothetical protein